jgi:hypothetical protein
MSPDSVRSRDRSLRRLRTVNRVVIGGSVLLTGLLSDVAANAFAGHTRRASAATIPATSGGTATSGSTGSSATAGSTSSSRRRSRHHSLQPPAQAPSSQGSTAPTPTAAPQPVAPVVVPAPVVSGGS